LPFSFGDVIISSHVRDWLIMVAWNFSFYKEVQMKHCTIHPIPLWISPSDKSHMTYFANLGQPVCVTGYI